MYDVNVLKMYDMIGYDVAYWYRCYRSVVCVSAKFMHCAQTAQDINVHTTAPCLSQIILKLGLHQLTTSQILPQSDPSLLI